VSGLHHVLVDSVPGKELYTPFGDVTLKQILTLPWKY